MSSALASRLRFLCQLHASSTSLRALSEPISCQSACSSSGSSTAAAPVASAPTRLQPSSSTTHQSNRQAWIGSRSFSKASEPELRVLHPEQMSEQEFHHKADDTLHLLQDKIEALVEDLEVEDGDVEFGMGVLTIKLGRHGTFVINKQTPNRQIWVSSPVSGPYRYDWLDGVWVYHRDGITLLERMEQEFEQLFDVKLELRG